MKIKTNSNQWSDVSTFKSKVGMQWHDVTHVKGAGQWYPIGLDSPEDATITLGLDGLSNTLTYTVSQNQPNQYVVANYYSSDNVLLSTQTVALTASATLSIPTGAVKVELYDEHPTSTYRRITSNSVISVLKWAKRLPTLNNQRFNNCVNLVTVPNEAPIATDFTSMFSGCANFNQDISGWDVSNVTNMNTMFFGCTVFNRSLTNWDVSKVYNMGSMFNSCTSFNSNLSGWNVSGVITMTNMFNGCRVFNQPLSNWNVSKVTNMGGMFTGCRVFNQPLSNWNVSKVTNMTNMFQTCYKFNQNISGWNVGNVSTLDFMFTNCTEFNQNLSGWCVSKITITPSGFSSGAPLLTAAKIPVWGTCPLG